ncbi:InlB B-repeat-containing protein [Holdemania massiliensis]|uniref:InlB B-repeat-containing protein n=1 Tax=Holdemania massiliensis TaxID=1468449 RepID=UPI001F059F39|nr:InlB B-repeat-containing protein [Holdemania massiliensis]MCH1940290.1 InlB B-repeat-containing protein [Holdemania massiliensis]
MKITSRFDKVLKWLTVLAMTMSCFTDMPIRVVAESFDVDSVVSIESSTNGADASDSVNLTVSVTVNGQTVSAAKSVAPGTLTVRANDGYEIDSMDLDGTAFNDTIEVQETSQSLNISAHPTTTQVNEPEETEKTPEPTVTPETTPEVSEEPEVTETPEVTEPTETPTVTPEVTQTPETAYELSIEHYLEYEGVQYSDQTGIVELSSDSFVEGRYDYSSAAIQKEGLNVISQKMIINQDSFEEGKATVTIEYAIAEGYEIQKFENEIATFALVDATRISDLNIMPINTTSDGKNLNVERVDENGNSLGTENISIPNTWTLITDLAPSNQTLIYEGKTYQYVEIQNQGYSGDYSYIKSRNKSPKIQVSKNWIGKDSTSDQSIVNNAIKNLKFVYQSVVEATDIEITGDDVVNVGKQIKLNAVLTPAEAENSITWSTGNSYIASVNNGVVTGWTPGKVIITAKSSNGLTATKEITVTNNVTINFDLNGGTGTKPSNISANSGSIVTLPDGSGITRTNYILLGWSTSRDASSVYEKTDVPIAPTYPLNDSYEVPEKNTTLYAVWAQISGSVWGNIKIAIRKDGIVPAEPSIQYANYIYLADNKDLANVNLLDYFNPAHTVAGVENVANALQEGFYTYVNRKKRLKSILEF